jgi:hypothetical protein
MAKTYQLVQLALGGSVIFTFIVHLSWLTHVPADCALYCHTTRSLMYNWQPIVQEFKPPVFLYNEG